MSREDSSVDLSIESLNSIRSKYQGKRVMVIGATGFIGRWTARGLNASGANLILPVRNKVDARRIFNEYEVDGEVIQVDLMRDDIRAVIDHARPVIVFNLAGYGIDRKEAESKAAYKINSELIADLCGALSRPSNDDWFGQRLVHTGTAMEYGAAGGDLIESTVAKPTTLYGKSKLKGTKILSDYCSENLLKAVACRLFAVYGPGENSNRLVPLLFESTQESGLLKFTEGTHKRDFCYVEEVAEGLMRVGISRAEKGSIINIATGKLTSIRTFIEISAERLGIHPERLLFGELATRTEEMNHLPVNIRKLRNNTGWQPTVDIDEGIRRIQVFQSDLGRVK